MKFVPMIAGSMSGKMGAVVASHNAGGQYFRRRSIPTNPNTARQQTTRSVMGGLAQYWSSDLTESERNAWREYAANTPYTDRVGETITMSGLNAFVRSNSLNLIWAEEGGVGPGTILDAAPVIFNTGAPPLGVPSFAADFTTPPGTTNITVSFASPADEAGDTFLFVAAPQTNGTRFYKGPYQLAATGQFSATDQSVDIDVSLEAPTWLSENVPVAGWDELFVPVRIVNRTDDGRVSQEFRELIEFTDETSP